MKRILFKSKLGTRFIVAIMAVCLLFAILLVYVSASLYTRRVVKHYNEFGYKVSKLVSKYFTEDEIKEYADIVFKYNRSQIDESKVNEVVNSEKYRNAFDRVNELRKELEFNDIFICAIDLDVLNTYDAKSTNLADFKPLYYIMDTHFNDDLRQNFAKSDSLSPKYIDSIIESINTGKSTETNFLQNGRYGYTITSVNSFWKNENMLVMVGCDISVESYQKDIISFIIMTIIVVFVLTLILIFVSVFIISRYFLNPVIEISSEVGNFVSNNAEISNKLGSFKTGDEIELLAKSILKMQQDLFNYMDDAIAKAIKLKKVRTELNLAKGIQADMLPSIFPAFPNRDEFDLFASMTPAKEVGGDFYDFFFIDDDHLGLVIADVSGKGVPAALFMVIAKTLIKDRANVHVRGEDYSPAEILTHVNAQLCENNKNELFVTVWFGILEISTGKCTTANAGHEYPAICKKDEKYELIKDKHSPAVATIEGIKFRDQEFQLNPGDSLFVYTDGVTEATNANGELFGEQRLVESLNKCVNASVSDVLRVVKEDVDKFVGSAPQFDDLTMLSFRYYGKGGHQ